MGPHLRGAYDYKAAAAFICVSERTMRRLMHEGHIASFLPAGKKRGRIILASELDRYLAASAGVTLGEAS